MALTKEHKNELIGSYHTHDTDTGSPDVQIALLTARITELTEHLKEHKHDYSTRRGLIKMVGRRRKLLRYLYKSAPERYAAVISRLGLKREDVKISGR
ncbi:MAG: 30S ribosomal protein S15 [Candidatus Sericytochromatia bacterium]|nr:30S ribosomal protein S15 [Candidatus Sericytochromatia bacterium]